MCCIAQIAMFVFGIIALVKGKFALTGSRIVDNVPARIIGVILILPLAMGLLALLIILLFFGAQFTANGEQFSIQSTMSLSGPLAVVNVGLTIISLLTAFGIAIGTSKSRKSKRRRLRDGEDDEDYDDRPRRRRDDDQDEDEPPRQRRRDDEDDEPPRRRPPDDRFRER
jgi:hypothetical protein